VEDLVGVLTRDGQFIQPIAVRDEGASKNRLVTGYHRFEAWKRCFGEQRPIEAFVYAPDTPDEVITVFEADENLVRNDLTADEREAQALRLAAALKKLDGEKPATELPVSGSHAKSAAKGGRGKKAATAKLADRIGLSKAGLQKRIKATSAAIGEEIDLDLDTPEELERKADKRLQAESKVEPRNLIRIPLKRPTSLAKPGAAEIGSQIEALWKAFDGIGKANQLRFIYYACLRLGLDPSKMASPAEFGLADEESEADVGLPVDVAPATDDAVAERVEHEDEVAVAQAKEEYEAALAQAEKGDDGAESGAENLQDTSDHPSEVADEEPDLAVDLPAEVAPATDAADSGIEDLQDAGDNDSGPAHQEPVGEVTCAYCNMEFLSGDQRYEINGRLYHDGFCLDYGKKIATVAE